MRSCSFKLMLFTEQAKMQHDALKLKFEDDLALRPQTKDNVDQESSEILKRIILASYDDVETTDSEAEDASVPSQGTQATQVKPPSTKQAHQARKAANAADLLMSKYLFVSLFMSLL